MVVKVALLNFFRLTLSTTNYPTELIEKLIFNILGESYKKFDSLQTK